MPEKAKKEMIRDSGDTGNPVLNLIIGLFIIIGLPIIFYQMHKMSKDTSDRPGGRIEELREFINSNENKIEKIIIIMRTVDDYDNSEITIRNKNIINEFQEVIYKIKKEDKVAGISDQKYRGTYIITFYLDERKSYTIMLRSEPANENPNKSYVLFFKNSFFNIADLNWYHGDFPNYFKAGDGYSGNTYIDYKIFKFIVHVKNLTSTGHNRKEQVYIHFH